MLWPQIEIRDIDQNNYQSLDILKNVNLNTIYTLMQILPHIIYTPV